MDAKTCLVESNPILKPRRDPTVCFSSLQHTRRKIFPERSDRLQHGVLFLSAAVMVACRMMSVRSCDLRDDHSFVVEVCTEIPQDSITKKNPKLKRTFSKRKMYKYSMCFSDSGANMSAAHWCHRTMLMLALLRWRSMGGKEQTKKQSGFVSS